MRFFCFFYLMWVGLTTITFGSTDTPLFMGIIIQDNHASVETFLKTLEELEYPKTAIDLKIDILNENAQIEHRVREWCERYKSSYASISCHVNRASSIFIKNDYLASGSKHTWIFIASSDVFLRPFTLRWLVDKQLPIVAPLLRPLPHPNDAHRNFFLSATEEGFFKAHPDHYAVSERAKIGVFPADCVHGAYLIQSKYAKQLRFEEDSLMGVIAFSNSARNNGVSQFICNEREFGFFIHTQSSPREVALPFLAQKVSRTTVKEISAKFDDPDLKTYQESFPIENYCVYPVQEDLYWVDEKWDWIKSCFVKKGLVWEPQIQELFKKYIKEGDTVIDIGGHIGTHSIFLSHHVGPNGKVHVFEPQAKVFTELLVNLALNSTVNVVPHRVALGSSEGSSFMEPFFAINEGTAHITESGEKVSIKTLDSFEISNVSLIKIDVEGYEIETLKGALSTLKRNRPVLIIEVFQGPENEQKLNFIKNLGYEITHVGGDDYLCLPTHKNA